MIEIARLVQLVRAHSNSKGVTDWKTIGARYNATMPTARHRHRKVLRKKWMALYGTNPPTGTITTRDQMVALVLESRVLREEIANRDATIRLKYEYTINARITRFLL